MAWTPRSAYAQRDPNILPVQYFGDRGGWNPSNEIAAPATPPSIPGPEAGIGTPGGTVFPPMTAPTPISLPPERTDPTLERIATPPGSPPFAPSTTVPMGRRVRIFSRSDQLVQVDWITDEAAGQSVGIINSGVNIVIDGLGELEGQPVGTIDISADRLVIWTKDIMALNEQRQEAVQLGDVELELYVDGNIVFRQADRVIYADRMYFDVNRQMGKIIEPDIRFPVPSETGTSMGILRLKADVVRLKGDIHDQIGWTKMLAEDAFVTSSRLGVPGYRLQANEIEFEDIASPVFDKYSGAPAIELDTGEQKVAHQRTMSATNNFLFLRRVPVFYWPWLKTDLEEPTFFIRKASIRNDQVFGTQVLTGWNMYELTGIDRLKGTRWTGSIDYLSKRGLGHGTSFLYSGEELFDRLPGTSAGAADYWGIYDDGFDNLGLGRRHLEPETKYRGRLFWQHRERFYDGFLGGYTLTAEAGWISDRNFLEEYQEREWDTLKDQDARVALSKSRDNMSWSFEADYRVNDFFTKTDWLPRGDHFLIGQDLFYQLMTWSEHTYAGYGHLNTTNQPKDPADRALFHYLPWELNPAGDPLTIGGEVFTTRHSLEMPLQLGPAKMTPYVVGQLDHWGEDAAGDDMQRVFGQAGLRATVPMWKVDPSVQNPLLNLNGLAHKINFNMELLVADSSQELGDVPLYDPLDDVSIEAFRRRFIETTYGGALPRRFDERYYALRSNMQSWVTAQSPQIADDLVLCRLGMRHRWQTKRGMPGQQRIVDWITFDTNINLFPKADRDNFGESAGLLDYDFQWHVGERFSVLSNGAFDFFDQGQQLVTVGALLNKPSRGNIYVGWHSLNGAFSSSILTASFNYRLSQKWITSFGTSYDLADDRNIGQNIGITRIGESFLVRLGFTVDTSRDNVGVQFAIEPRFLSNRLGQVGGGRIPLAGADRFE